MLGMVAGLILLSVPHSASADSSWSSSAASRLVATGIEPADCSAPTPGEVGCFALRGARATPAQVARAEQTPGTRAAAAAGDSGPYGPADLRSMYGVPAAARSSLTVAIIEAGAGVNTAALMGMYRDTFDLPSCLAGCFTELNQRGGTHLPYIYPSDGLAEKGWLIEADLDVQAVSATCPTCHILLVDADSPSTDDMDAAVQTAASHGADVVSMSWGSALGDDPHAADDRAIYLQGPLYVAATGDNGYYSSSGLACAGVQADTCGEYPAAFANVVAVGGTSVMRSGGGWSTTAWGSTTAASHDGAGSGCTADQKPTWQSLPSAATTCAGRGVSDVSALADPHTGLMVLIDNGDGTAGEVSIGGTSVATPIVAALYALEGNKTVGPAAPYTNLSGATAAGGGAAQAILTDVTDPSHVAATGTCSTSSWCEAATGWDGPTGLGTPAGLGLFSDVAPGAVTAVLSPESGVDLVGQVGVPVSEKPLSVVGGTSSTWTVTPALPSGLSINPSTGVISGTPTATGHSVVTISARGASEQIAIDVYGALAVTGGAVSATVGRSLSVLPVSFSGGSGKVDWSSEDLPDWLGIDPATGRFVGVPTASDVGTTTVTVTARDHADPAIAGQATVSVTVAAGPVPSASPTPGPATAVFRTEVHVRLGRVVHTRRAKVRVSVLGGSPAGSVAVYDGTHRIAVARVTPLNHAGFSVLLKKLARGRHRLKIVFTPTVATVAGSTTFVTARVR